MSRDDRPTTLADLPLVLKVADLRELLDVGENQVYQALADGEIPHAFRVGRSWRIPRHGVAKLLGLEGDDPGVGTGAANGSSPDLAVIEGGPHG